MKLDDAAAHLEALGNPTRLKIYRALVRAGDAGMPVGRLQDKLKIAPSTLSHHLEKLKNERLVKVRRNKKFLWYTANTEALQDLLGFLFSECCTRTNAVHPESIIRLCK